MFKQSSRIAIGGSLLAAAASLAIGQSAQATSVDLTAGAGTSGTVNGGIFEFGETQPTGTGVFDPFLRIASEAGQTDGYNTSGDPIPSQFEVQSGGSSPWTHDLVFGDLDVVQRSGVDYIKFLLDINEPGGANALLSLDEVQIYTNPTGNQLPSSPSSLGTLRYDLDGLADSWILMDASNSHGSGSSDMNFFIPLANFAGTQNDDFVYLYALFGGQQGFEADHGGFEEFAAVTARSTAIPTPAAAGLGLLCLSVLGLSRRNRRHEG